jgi:hypothetical protein
LKRLLLTEDRRPRLLGRVVLLLVTLLAPKMLSDALDGSRWVDFTMFIVWFVVVPHAARRMPGLRV